MSQNGTVIKRYCRRTGQDTVAARDSKRYIKLMSIPLICYKGFPILFTMLIDIYLTYRQFNLLLSSRYNANFRILMTKQIFDKSTAYNLMIQRFKLVTKTLKVIAVASFIHMDGFVKVWNISTYFVVPGHTNLCASILCSCILVNLYNIYNTIVYLYFNFAIEAKFRFNNQSVARYLFDSAIAITLKTLAVIVAVVAIIMINVTLDDFFRSIAITITIFLLLVSRFFH
ncbi:hypothetical protein GJ496_001269 [Pomphorhynchus laevis]|nr:hypothetical protein GJ496_001269 [Pomphorhynchus laevis]